MLRLAGMLIPTAIYGVLILGQKFPKGLNIVSDTGENIKGILTPLFIVMALIMTVTATTEFGATQWIERILGNAGANAMILLAMTAGIMACGRFFAGPLIQSFNASGVLIGSAALYDMIAVILHISDIEQIRIIVALKVTT